MVTLNAVQETNKLTFGRSAYVAVFVGATSGIGEYTALELANQYSNNDHKLRHYLVGRNVAEGERVIAECTTLCPGGDFVWIKAQDLALMADVDSICQEILDQEQRRCRDEKPHIDLLFMTQGKVYFGGRSDTTEGVDRTMSLIYYSRIRFTTKLMPFLQMETKTAHVVSVYGAGLEAKLFPQDLSLREHYSFGNARSHIVHMTTMAFERFSKEHPNLGLVHVFPGVMVTPSYTSSDMPFWFRAMWFVAGPLIRATRSIAPQEAAQRMLSLASARFACRNHLKDQESGIAVGTAGSCGSGCYAVGADSDPVLLTKDYDRSRRQGFEKLVWDHTQDFFACVDSGIEFHG